VDTYSFEHPPIIELYDIDLSVFGEGIYRFHPYETELSVMYLGNTYSPLPIEVEGFEVTNKGLPTPKITVSNVLGTMSDLIDRFDGLQGAKLIRTKLESHEPPHSYSNSDLVGTPDIYIIDRPTAETKLKVTFELRSIFDLASLKLPRRTIFQSRCSVVYKSSECGYIGSLPSCNRSVDDCLTHFQNMTSLPSPVINTASFPGVDRYPN
jgi:lambda family phage minor tail protein L